MKVPIHVFLQDQCPRGLPEIWTVARVMHRSLRALASSNTDFQVRPDSSEQSLLGRISHGFPNYSRLYYPPLGSSLVDLSKREPNAGFGDAIRARLKTRLGTLRWMSPSERTGLSPTWGFREIWGSPMSGSLYEGSYMMVGP